MGTLHNLCVPLPCLQVIKSRRRLWTGRNHAASPEQTKRKVVVKKFVPAVLVLGAVVLDASAQSTPSSVAADATGIVTQVTTTANLVMGLCVTLGTFFGVYKVVKWIRK